MSLRAAGGRLGPVALLLLAVVAAASLATMAPGARRAVLATSCPASGPPCPANAYLGLTVTAGPPNTDISISGFQFLPGESMSLYWDTPSKVVGSATTDGRGNFSGVHFKPFAGDPPGLHHICASVTPNPCVQFQLLPASPQSPNQSPSPSESPSPTETPTPTSSPTPIPIPAGSTGGIDLIFKPPLVFLPLAGLVGLIAAVGWWLFTVFPRQQRMLPQASIVHRSARPTWGPPAESEDASAPDEGQARPPWPEPAPFEAQDEERTPWPAPNPPILDEPEDGPEQPEG